MYPIDVIDVLVSAEQVAIATGQAVLAERGGRSHVRAGAERQAALAEDQIVGQLTQMAFSLYLTGSLKEYRVQRHYCNLYPNEGDGGSDMPGTNLDVKGSLMRAGRDPLRYSLLVRPKERQAGKVYVLAMLARLPQPCQPVGVHLVGWAADDMLPQEPEGEGIFQGAYRLSGEVLHPLLPLRWWGW